MRQGTHRSFSAPSLLKGVCLTFVGLSSSVHPLQLWLLSRSRINSNAALYFCKATFALSLIVSSDAIEVLPGEAERALPLVLVRTLPTNRVLDTDMCPRLEASSAASEVATSDPGRLVLSGVLGTLPGRTDFGRSALRDQLNGLSLAPHFCGLPPSDPGRLPGIERCMLHLATLVGLAGKPWELTGRALILHQHTSRYEDD